MSRTKRRCSSCRWWEAMPPTPVGKCQYRPNALDMPRWAEWPETTYTYESEGHDCPVYSKRKEEKI